jgi:hypothetical protein
MSFEIALQQALLDVQASLFPEVEKIETGYDYDTDFGCAIYINSPEENLTDSGGCQSNFITQKQNVLVILRIEKENPDTSEKQVKVISDKVINALTTNPTLISASYPDGFLITGGVLKNEDGDDNIGGPVKVQYIPFEGKYLRSKS